MSAAAKEIVEAALKLDPQVRAEVAEEILGSLEDSSYGELSPEWEAELDRRADDIDKGRVQVIPAEEVFAEIEGLLRTGLAGKVARPRFVGKPLKRDRPGSLSDVSLPRTG